MKKGHAHIFSEGNCGVPNKVLRKRELEPRFSPVVVCFSDASLGVSLVFGVAERAFVVEVDLGLTAEDDEVRGEAVLER